MDDQKSPRPMGMESRDYYRDWWRKRTGYSEKARFRVPASHDERATDVDHAAGAEYLGPEQRSIRTQGPPDVIGVDLHWSIKLIVFLVVLVSLLALRSLPK